MATKDLSCCHQNDSENNSTDGDSIELDYTQGNNNTMLNLNNELDSGYSFPKRESVDLAFHDIRYDVKKFAFSRKKIGYVHKEILHGISGEFKSGKLTAIMGPSGAGKSTLLNIMAGYVCTGVTGAIEVNGRLRPKNSESFRELSCYIHQDDVLRLYLTVKESMMIATHLKLGYNVPFDEKKKLIKKILVLLGLDKRYNTYTSRLSGGQKKRLAIALEMISNPPVLFLDEPTTGLDSSSCTQCILLLKRLAQEGRTVVCTIHQPSALLFEIFDNLYALSEGHCIYQGRIKELVPFLSDLGLHCPPYHNPADFLIEVSIGEYGSDVSAMVNATRKKFKLETEIYNTNSSNAVHFTKDRSKNYDKTTGKNDQLVENLNLMTSQKNASLNGNGKLFTENVELQDNREICYEKNNPASMLMQFLLLYKRNLVSSRRNYFMVLARIIAHAFIAGVFGYLYVDVGDNANAVFGNYVYLYGTILLIVYTGKMSVMMSFPVEMEMLTREHFNRWYKLGPYFLSVLMFEIPFQILCATLYVIISYWLTGNFNDMYRFFYFLVMCCASTLCAQGWGFFIGATLPVKLAVFCGPVLAVVFSVFGFCTRYVDITPLLRWMWHISYFRAGFHSIINSVYGMDRQFLTCPEGHWYCHFRDPTLFLKEISIDNINMTENISLLTGVFFTMHILTVIVLWYRLNKR